MARLRLCSAIFASWLAAACSSSSTSSSSPTAPEVAAANIAGAWTGTLESTNFPSRAVTLTVVQSGSCVDGGWTNATGDWKGAISGYASVDAFSGFISLERADAGGRCVAAGTASGPASTTALRMSITGLTPVGDCAGELPTDVVLNLHR